MSIFAHNSPPEDDNNLCQLILDFISRQDTRVGFASIKRTFSAYASSKGGETVG